jgi:hypothetical protein
LEYPEDYGHELKNKENPHGVGKGENVFWIYNNYIYLRNLSLYEEKLCKGIIK